MSWAKIRKENRLTVHRAFALPTAKYLAPGATAGSEIDVTVRVHTREKRTGDLHRGGYAEVIEDITSVVFLNDEVLPERRAILTLHDGRRFSLDKQLPADDDLLSTWAVEEKTPVAGTSAELGSYVDLRAGMREAVHAAFAQPGATYAAPGSATPVPVSVRLHIRGNKPNEIEREGFAVIEDGIPTLIFRKADITPQRKGTVTLADGRRYALDLQVTPSGAEFDAWEAVELSRVAPLSDAPTDFRMDTRTAIHKIFALPPALYTDPDSGEATTVSVRVYQSEAFDGNPTGAGFAQTVSDVYSVALLNAEIVSKVRGVVTLADGRRYRLDVLQETSNEVVSRWTVSELSAVAPTLADNGGYFIDTRSVLHEIVHATFALQATYYDADDNATPIAVRLHSSAYAFGDLGREGYAKVVEGLSRLVFVNKTLALTRGGRVEFEDGQTFVLDVQHAQAADNAEAWDATRTGGPVVDSQTYASGDYFAEIYAR